MDLHALLRHPYAVAFSAGALMSFAAHLGSLMDDMSGGYFGYVLFFAPVWLIVGILDFRVDSHFGVILGLALYPGYFGVLVAAARRSSWQGTLVLLAAFHYGCILLLYAFRLSHYTSVPVNATGYWVGSHFFGLVAFASFVGMHLYSCLVFRAESTRRPMP